MKFKLTISLFLAVAVATIFSMRSLAFAQAEKAKTTPRESVAATDAGSQDQTGALTTSGYVTINGNEARTGATVLNESVIATGEDSDATIDLGPLGRIQLRPGTKIKLTMSPNNCRIVIERCGSLTHFVPAGVVAQAQKAEPGLMEVTVLPGAARVTTSQGDGGGMTIKSGENHVFETFESVTANGETVYTLNCCDCEVPANKFFVPPPIFGFFGMVAAGVTTSVVGVVTGGDDFPVSPMLP